MKRPCAVPSSQGMWLDRVTRRNLLQVGSDPWSAGRCGFLENPGTDPGIEAIEGFSFHQKPCCIKLHYFHVSCTCCFVSYFRGNSIGKCFFPNLPTVSRFQVQLLVLLFLFVASSARRHCGHRPEPCHELSLSLGTDLEIGLQLKM